MRFYTFILTFLLLNNIAALQAQNSTFEKMQAIFDAKCTIGCHSGENPAANLDLTADLGDVHKRLIDVEPVNPFAKEKGYKLVTPGFPDKSLLFRKCNNNLYHTSKLEQEEGQAMPIDQPALSEVEIEIMRQWIQEGAPIENIVDNEAIIKEYYDNGGLPKIEKPAAPAADEGFQVYFGTLFLEPGKEIEVIKKVQLDLEENVEVNRLEFFIYEFSHHLIISKFNEEQSAKYPNDIQTIGSVIDQGTHFFASEYVAISQTDYLNIELPEKTAFAWKNNTDLSINYHVKNYSESSVFPGEVYMNVYTQDVGTAEREMKSALHSYGDSNPFLLNIANTGKDTTLTMQVHLNEFWDIWIIQGHTHQLGVDYDMFLRNEDGSKGEQIYEGYYDFDYEFDQGFFDYAHPPVRQFEPLLTVDMNKGLYYEATYNNPGDEPVGFGLTTDDEMFITYLLYTEAEEPVSVNELTDLSNEVSINAFPNPFKDQTLIRYSLNQATNVDLSLFDVTGQKIHQLHNGVQQSNEHTLILDKNNYNLSAGMYLLKLTTKNGVSQKKILIFD